MRHQEHPWGQRSSQPLSSAPAENQWRRWQRRRPDTKTGTSIVGNPESSFQRTAKLARLEAALLVADGPLSGGKLAQYATLADATETGQLIRRLNAAYDAADSAFRVERLATGYRLLTRPALSFWLSRLHQRQGDWRLSAPQMETLTIVAYRQPITRADIEAIRGVQSAEMLKQLMDRGLVRIGGEEDSLGRPFLYITTRKFLEQFGIGSLNDLPMAETLRRPSSSTALPSGDAEHDDTETPASAAA